MNVLVTGGAGYIGSHAVMRLLEAGHAVTAIDDLSRGHVEAVEAMQGDGDLRFVEMDIADRDTMAPLLRERAIDVVMHFAALTYVGESVTRPLDYYRNNTGGAIALLQAMQEAGVGRFVFSSTCATYGEPGPDRIPLREDCPQAPINPYGHSKLMVERVLADHGAAEAMAGRDFAYAALRYFNVAGSDPRGRIGEDHDPETHLIPICLEAALGQRDGVTIFGTDYPTPDGTCIRDYVHVVDLIDAHMKAMAALKPGAGLHYNVGTGQGHSVREVIDACRTVTGVDFPAAEGTRRPGDPPTLYAAPGAIRRDLGWSAERADLATMVADAWTWFRAHPNGYRGG